MNYIPKSSTKSNPQNWPPVLVEMLTRIEAARSVRIPPELISALWSSVLKDPKNIAACPLGSVMPHRDIDTLFGYDLGGNCPDEVFEALLKENSSVFEVFEKQRRPWAILSPDNPGALNHFAPFSLTTTRQEPFIAFMSEMGNPEKTDARVRALLSKLTSRTIPYGVEWDGKKAFLVTCSMRRGLRLCIAERFSGDGCIAPVTFGLLNQNSLFRSYLQSAEFIHLIAMPGYADVGSWPSDQHGRELLPHEIALTVFIKERDLPKARKFLQSYPNLAVYESEVADEQA
ncbi:MAG: hypothetical protein ABI230_00620 [Aestuariivirga sp.]